MKKLDQRSPLILKAFVLPPLVAVDLSVSHQQDATCRLIRTMTRLVGFVKMSIMRTVVIFATVAIAAAQMMWRVMRPPKLPDFAMEWTADE